VVKNEFLEVPDSGMSPVSPIFFLDSGFKNFTEILLK
jgi:hypothetical protein